MGTLKVAFVGGSVGAWRIERQETVSGQALPAAERLDVAEGFQEPGGDPTWVLRGVTSNERYVTRREHELLASRQQPLGRQGQRAPP